MRAFRYFDSYKGGDAKSWLFTIVRNTFFTWRARKQREGAPEPFDEAAHSCNLSMQNQEKQMADAARIGILRNCIEALPAEFREVLVMRELEEMPYRQISDVVCIPVGTVMSRLSRARRRLEDCARASEIRMGK